MPEPIRLRNQRIADELLVIRLGRRTLSDVKLAEQCTRTRLRWGVDGFSVFEVPDGDWEWLARLNPIVTKRRWLFEADGPELVAAGFALLATGAFPHWTVVLSEPTPVQFARVRSCFRGPMRNRAYGP